LSEPRVRVISRKCSTGRQQRLFDSGGLRSRGRARIPPRRRIPLAGLRQATGRLQGARGHSSPRPQPPLQNGEISRGGGLRKSLVRNSL
jgi:hypothetical protein